MAKAASIRRKIAPELVMLAFFDVLGFSAKFLELGIEEMTRKYRSLLASAKQAARQPDVVREAKEDEFPSSLLQVSPLFSKAFFVGAPTIQHAYFSDTILLWSSYREFAVAPFLEACVAMMQKSLDAGLPLRGAISIGLANFDRTKGIYLGYPLIDAAIIEKMQRWIGVTFADSFTGEPFNKLYLDYMIPYSAHFKSVGDRKKLAFVLDWPRFCRSAEAAPIESKITSLDSNNRFSEYYSNTLEFIEYSERYSDWANNPDQFLSNYPHP